MTVRRWRAPALLAFLLAILAALGWYLNQDGPQRIAGISGSLQGIAPEKPSTAPSPPASADRAQGDKGEPTRPTGDAPGSADGAARQATNRENGPGTSGEPGRGSAGEGQGAQAARSAPVETLPETKPGESAPGSNAAREGRSAATNESVTSLDVVRVEPNGDSVIAGRSAPNATIEVLRDNKPIAAGKADAGGNFAILPPALPTGSSELSYRAVAPDGRTVQGNESVAVVIAENRKTKPLVAVSTPDKPTQVLSRPEAQATAEAPAKPEQQPQADAERKPAGAEAKPPQRMSALPTPQPDSANRQPVQIVSIDARGGGRLDVSATGAPGSTLRLYLNDTMVANGQAGADGKLTFTIGRGVRPGAYQVRIDQLEGGGVKVAQRAQVAFTFPEALAPPTRTAQNPAPAQTGPDQLKPDSSRPGLGNADAGRSGMAGSDPAQRASPTAPSVPAPADQAAAPPLTSSPTPPPNPPLAARSTPSGQPAQVRTGEQAGREAADRSTGGNASAERGPPSAERGTTAERASPEAEPSPASARPAVEPTAVPPEKAKRLARVLPPARPGPETLLAGAARKGPTLASGRERTPADVAPQADARAQVEKPDVPSDSTGSAPGTVFVDEVATARITRGDNLWQISRRSYGSGVRYTVIYDANRDQIRNPDLIYPGQIFVLPRDEGAAKRG